MSFKFFRINSEMPEKGNRVISYPERIFLQVTVHTSSKSFIDEYNSIIFILLATSIPFIDWAVFTEMIRIKYFSDFVSDWSMAFELWKYISFFQQNFITHFFRYLVVKYGKWNDPACVARNLEKEKLQFPYFVRKLSLENENSWR